MYKKWSSNLKIYIINGILYSIMFNLYSPFAVKFLERIGGTEFHISLFNALPGLVAVFAILPGTVLVMRSTSKKKMTALFFLLSRIFLLAVAFVPWFPAKWMPLIFIVLISLRNFPEAISQSAFQSFSGDVFGPDERSTAITLRNWFSTPATLLVTLAAGLILSKLPVSQAQTIFTYQIFFIAAFITGIVETAVFLLMEDSPSTGDGNEAITLTLLDIFKDSKFLSFTKTSLAFYFSWQMGWPIFNIYSVITLGADEWWLSAIVTAGLVGMFLGYNFWNRIIMQKGNRYALWAATLGLSLNPLIMAFSPNLYFVTFLNLPMGFFTAGVTTALLNNLLEATPEKNRVIYIGVYNTLVNLSLAISPFFAHLVLKTSNIYIALLTVAFLRFTSSMLFYRKGEPRADI